MLNNPLTQKTKRIQHGAVEYVKDNSRLDSTPPPPPEPSKASKDTAKKSAVGAKMAKKPGVSAPPSKDNSKKAPSSPNPLETTEESENSDVFLVASDVLNESWVASVELPKMTLRSVGGNQQTVKDKSTILVHLENSNQNIAEKMHAKVLSGAKKDNVKLEIYWLDPETLQHENPKAISVWRFSEAKVTGIDFGSAEYERTEKPILTIEFEYKNINIDGTEI